MALCVRVGTFDEERGTSGYSSLIEGCLQLYNFQGEDGAPHEDYLQLNGGTSQSKVTEDYTLTGFRLPSEKLEGALTRMGKLWSNPPFSRDIVKRQMDLAVHHNAQRSSEWEFKVNTQLRRLLAPGTVLGNTGVINTDARLDDVVRTIAQFWEEHYSADKMYLVVHSQLSVIDMEVVIHRNFGSIPRRTTRTRQGMMSSVILPEVSQRFIKTFNNEASMVVFRWYVDEIPAGCQANPAEFIERVLAVSLSGEDKTFKSVTPVCSLVPPDGLILTITFDLREDYPINVQAVQDRLNAVFNIALRTPKFDLGGQASFGERVTYAAELMRFCPYRSVPQVATQGPLQSREERKLYNDLLSKILATKPLLLVRSLEEPSMAEEDYVEQDDDDLKFAIIPRTLLPAAAEERIRKSDIGKLVLAFAARGVERGPPTKYQLLSDMMDVITQQYGIRCCIEMMNENRHVGFVFEGAASKDWISPLTAIIEIFTGKTPAREEFGHLFRRAKQRGVRSSERSVIQSQLIHAAEAYALLLADARMDHLELFTDPSPREMKYEQVSKMAQNMTRSSDGFVLTNGKLSKATEQELFQCILGDRPISTATTSMTGTAKYFEALATPERSTPRLPEPGGRFYYIPPALQSSNVGAVSICALLNVNVKAKLTSMLYARTLTDICRVRANSVLKLEQHVVARIAVEEVLVGEGPAIVISAQACGPSKATFDRMVAFLGGIPVMINKLSDETLQGLLLRYVDNELITKEFSKRGIADHRLELSRLAESSLSEGSPLLRWVVVELWSGIFERQRNERINWLKCTDQSVFSTLAEYPRATIEPREKQSCCVVQ